MKIKFENKAFIEVDDVYLTSDLHLSHKNLCSATSEWEDKERCRQFSSIEEMNKTILEGINNNVKPNDCLIILGDVLFGEKDYEKLFSKINCENIIYIFGNHCSYTKFNYALNNSISTNLKIKFHSNLTKISIDKQEVVLCHYPMIHWENQDRGSFLMHGHLHGYESKWVKEFHDTMRAMDVGIDVAYKELGEYVPFKWEYIKEKLKSKPFNLERH